jgi:4-alpha-glucanotransferase
MKLGVWQFLPLGPTAYGDSPYQPLSAFAGNPNLVGLEPLSQLGLLTESELQGLRDLPGEFTDYGRLIPVKNELLKRASSRFTEKQGAGLLAEYEQFLHEQSSLWLDDYALFRALKTAHGERPWPEWDKAYVHRESGALHQARNQFKAEIEQTRVTQFLFDRQWQALKAYATEKGIWLFGDMPIYIALDSADAWAHPELLQLDRDGRPSHVAGVPPDYFSEDGQLWGNPLYDWAYHKRRGFQWWIDRLRQASRQSHLVRIDHFRGFESFWSVASGESTARTGEWISGPGDALFEALRKSFDPLPIVAEDLGVITPEVDELRERHGLPGMVVLQFKVDDPDFAMEQVQENSVCYTGTHDNDTTLGWFQGASDDPRSKDEIENTRSNALALTGGNAASIHWDMLRLAFSAQSALAMAPMQDYLGLGSGARINTPGTTGNNWRWRMQADVMTPELVESVASLVLATTRKP